MTYRHLTWRERLRNLALDVALLVVILSGPASWMWVIYLVVTTSPKPY